MFLKSFASRKFGKFMPLLFTTLIKYPKLFSFPWALPLSALSLVISQTNVEALSTETIYDHSSTTTHAYLEAGLTRPWRLEELSATEHSHQSRLEGWGDTAAQQTPEELCRLQPPGGSQDPGPDQMGPH